LVSVYLDSLKPPKIMF